MACEPFKLADRTTGIICIRGQRTPRCRAPDCRSKATILCDYPVARKGMIATCDRGVCRKHAKNVGEDRDYCDRHRELPDPQQQPEQLGMFGGNR